MIYQNNSSINLCSSIIYGNSNIITGSFNIIYGNINKVYGSFNTIFGNENTIIGTTNLIIGHSNKIEGNSNSVSGNNNSFVGNLNMHFQSDYSISNTSEYTSITITNLNSTTSSNIEYLKVNKLIELPKTNSPETFNTENASLDRNHLENRCNICLVNYNNTCLVPCGHCNLCVSCSYKLFEGKIQGKEKCPICRTIVEKVIRIFK